MLGKWPKSRQVVVQSMGFTPKTRENYLSIDTRFGGRHAGGRRWRTGFLAALSEVYPQTGEQRCWVHKTVNVLDKLPKSLQSPAKSALHDIWQTHSRATAEQAFDRFVATYEDKYPQGGRLSGQGSRRDAGLLRLSGRVLPARPYHQSD